LNRQDNAFLTVARQVTGYGHRATPRVPQEKLAFRVHGEKLIMPTDPIKFAAGDKVVLDLGTYQGTEGVFVRLTAGDPRWAEIKQTNGIVRNHPVEWLGHAA
jgi:hypothetical protein